MTATAIPKAIQDANMATAWFGFPSSLSLATSNGSLTGYRPQSFTGWFAGDNSVSSISIPVASLAYPQIPAITNAALLERLHAQSGLTWEQIARLFNVSRRSIHLWLAGGRMSAANEERLIRIDQYVSALPGSPEGKRHQLLAATESGLSFFDGERAALASRPDDINRQLEPLAEEE